MNIFSRIALILLIIGGINWGLIGFFQFDLVAGLLGGQQSILSRIVYAIVGISAFFSIGLLFMSHEDYERAPRRARQSSQPNYSTEFSEEHEFKENDDKK